MKRSERGQSLAEFAIVAPLLFLLIAGIVDIGRAFHSYVIITNSAREGARIASRFPDNLPLIQTVARAEADGSMVSLNDTDITVPVGFNGTGGQPITVRVNYRFNTLLVFLIPEGHIDMQTQTTMTIFGLDGT